MRRIPEKGSYHPNIIANLDLNLLNQWRYVDTIRTENDGLSGFEQSLYSYYRLFSALRA